MAHRLPTEIVPGELRHRIQIVKPSGKLDSMGGVQEGDTNEWTVIRTCWASIEAWVGDATLAAGQFVSESSHWIVMRHPRDMTQMPTAGCRVWWNGRTFLIGAVLNPTETTKMLVLVATEINDSSEVAPTPVVT
jgi:SPP1 family predicted phage head-tail adaptor